MNAGRQRLKPSNTSATSLLASRDGVRLSDSSASPPALALDSISVREKMTNPAVPRLAVLIALISIGAGAIWLRQFRDRAAIAAATGVRPIVFTADLNAEPQPNPSRRWITPKLPLPVDAPALKAANAVFVRALTDTSVVVLTEEYTLEHATDLGVVTAMPSIDEALRMTTVPVTDMKLGPSGTIWLCNPSGQTVVVNAKTGSPTKAYRDGCYKVAPLSDGGAALLRDPRADDWFGIIGNDGNAISKFGQILQDQREYGRAILDGKIVEAAGILILIPNHLGFVAAFDRLGRVQYLMKGIDTDSLQQIRIEPGKVKVDRPQSSWRQLDLVVFEGYLVSLVGRRVEGINEGGLDIYDAKTGQYIHSVKLPTLYTGFALLPQAMYTIGADGLSLRKVDWHEVLAFR